MRRAVAIVVALGLALSACTGGGDDNGKDTTGATTVLPLPKKAPSARGPAVGPALEPKVLLAASDDLEELSGTLDTAQVERRSDAFISGRTVVGYSVDNISGYDLDSGDKRWTAQLDLGGGTVCFVSQPDRAVKTFTVAYGEGGYCPDLATVRVSDGKVVKLSDKLSGDVQFQGETVGGPVEHLFTVKGQDYVVDFDGVVWKMVEGDPEPVARLEADSYFTLDPTPKGDVLIGSRGSDRGKCRVDAYALPSFKHTWTTDSATVFPEVQRDCLITTAPGSSTWLAQDTGENYLLAQVDPATGEVLGRAKADKSSGGKAAQGEFDLASASNQLDQALGLPDGDTIFSQVNGLTRYSLKTGKVVWDLDLRQVQLDSTEDYPLTTFLPQGVTADGYLVATVTNDTAAEVVAVNVKTGRLAARWAVPAKYGNGFQVDPNGTLFGGGIVLTRNFEAWEFEYGRGDVPAPKGDLYDIGVFTFPKAVDKSSSAVPTAGPTDTDAKALGGLRTPAGAEGDRDAGSFSTGTRVVAYAGNVVTGLDPTSGKQTWKLTVDPDPTSRVCVASQPDQKVKTFTIAYRVGADGKCLNLVRVSASSGKILDRVAVPPSADSVSRIEVYHGGVHVITGDMTVSRIADGALVPEAKLPRQPYYLDHTPQAPSLLVATSEMDGGKEWAIDAYRMPSFEPVWSTTASAVFGKVPDNPVETWRGNGLLVSTTFGDTSAPSGKVQDALAQLDPKTGAAVSSTGIVKRVYNSSVPGTFSLTDAITSGYVTAGFKDGSVVLPQDSGVMRYSVADQKVSWAVDTSSIMSAMERDRKGTSVTQSFDVIDGGKTVLVTLSNDISVELMTLNASSGKITGRWNVPVASRNGLQAAPDVTTFAGGVALSRSDYSFDYAFRQSGRAVPSDPLFDVGLFALKKPKG